MTQNFTSSSVDQPLSTLFVAPEEACVSGVHARFAPFLPENLPFSLHGGS